jgi:hypothetical protein
MHDCTFENISLLFSLCLRGSLFQHITVSWSVSHPPLLSGSLFIPLLLSQRVCKSLFFSLCLLFLQMSPTVSVCVCLSLFLCLSFFLSALFPPFLFLSMFPSVILTLFVYLCVCVCVSLSVFLSTLGMLLPHTHLLYVYLIPIIISNSVSFSCYNNNLFLPPFVSYIFLIFLTVCRIIKIYWYQRICL